MAATREAGGASGFIITEARVLIASSVCSRAARDTEYPDFGRPPGFPETPGWNCHGLSDGLLTSVMALIMFHMEQFVKCRGQMAFK